MKNKLIGIIIGLIMSYSLIKHEIQIKEIQKEINNNEDDEDSPYLTLIRYEGGVHRRFRIINGQYVEIDYELNNNDYIRPKRPIPKPGGSNWPWK